MTHVLEVAFQIRIVLYNAWCKILSVETWQCFEHIRDNIALSWELRSRPNPVCTPLIVLWIFTVLRSFVLVKCSRQKCGLDWISPDPSSLSTETEISEVNLKLTLFCMAGNPALAPVREVCCSGREWCSGFGVGSAPGAEEKAEVSHWNWSTALHQWIGK